MKTASAFSPAGISSFFQICDTNPDGTPIADLAKMGSRGGGFGLKKGVLTHVCVKKAPENSVQVFLNGKLEPQAYTTKTVVQELLGQALGAYSVEVRHEIAVPVGAGFGTSAAGALTAGLALSETLDLPLTCNQIGTIAHIAEIKCKTGLGTATPMMLGGVDLVLEPGAPTHSVIDRLPLTPDYTIVAGIFEPTLTKDVLSSPEKRGRVNSFGKQTLDAILRKPSLENFLACCWQFAQDAGFATSRVKSLVEAANQAGAVGATQNMVGEAVHAVARDEDAGSVAAAFEAVLPKEKIVVSKIDFLGARLVGSHEEV
ncbi:MAG: hypothetical protein NWF04_04620 [Candidatus Bathyarchaeota archaeon]|nr:hypothetical protein [Candidatus Bathyarchaeota archaeon]